MRIHATAALIFAVLVAACDDRPKDGGLSARFFEQAKQLRQAGRLSLSAMAPGGWEKACYYGPYATESALGIDNSDGDWTIVFFKAGAEVARIQGADRRLTLRSHDGACFSRDEATLVWEGDTAVLRKP